MRYLGNYSISQKNSTITTTPFHLNGSNYFGVAFSRQTGLGATPKGLWSCVWIGENFKKLIKEADSLPDVIARKSAIKQKLGDKYLWAANPYSLEWNVFFGDRRSASYAISVHSDPDEISSRDPNVSVGVIGGNEFLVQGREKELTDVGRWHDLGTQNTKRIGMIKDAAGDLLRNKFAGDVTSGTWIQLKKIAKDIVDKEGGKQQKWWEARCLTGKSGWDGNSATCSYQAAPSPEWWTAIKLKDGSPSRFLGLLYYDQTTKAYSETWTRAEIRDRINTALDSLNELLLNFCKDIAPPGAPEWWTSYVYKGKSNSYYFGRNTSHIPVFDPSMKANWIPLAIEHGSSKIGESGTFNVPVVKLYFTLVYLLITSMPYPPNKKKVRDSYAEKIQLLAPTMFDLPYMKTVSTSLPKLKEALAITGLQPDAIKANFSPPFDKRPYTVIKLNPSCANIAGTAQNPVILVTGVPYAVPLDDMQKSFERHKSWWEKYGSVVMSVVGAVTSAVATVAIPGIGGKFSAVFRTLADASWQVTKMFVLEPASTKAIQKHFEASMKAQEVFNALMTQGGSEGAGLSPQDLPLGFVYWWPDQIASQLIRSTMTSEKQAGGLGSFSTRKPFFTWAEYYWMWMAWYIVNAKFKWNFQTNTSVGEPIYPYIEPPWVKAYQTPEQQAKDEKLKEKIEKTKKMNEILLWSSAGAATLSVGALVLWLIRSRRST